MVNVGYKVTVTGSVPVQTASGASTMQFRIRGEIDKAAVRKNAQQRHSKPQGLSNPLRISLSALLPEGKGKALETV